MPTINATVTPNNHRPFSAYPASALSAAWLDRLADAELQMGHHHAAEELAQRAAALRGDAR